MQQTPEHAADVACVAICCAVHGRLVHGNPARMQVRARYELPMCARRRMNSVPTMGQACSAAELHCVRYTRGMAEGGGLYMRHMPSMCGRGWKVRNVHQAVLSLSCHAQLTAPVPWHKPNKPGQFAVVRKQRDEVTGT